jgi:ubiquinone/menaquinone biosynthesis C-methylase UbiE/uncharacterized protein YbaR (Trm112 family)
MKTGKPLIVTAVAAGLLAFSLARYRRMKLEELAWRKQLRPAFDVLACPTCHGLLTKGKEQGYFCQVCQRKYPTVGGITHFFQSEELTGWNKRFSGLYDWFSWVYRAFSWIAFTLIGIPEEQARREVTDRLQPMGGRVLEVSIGPGVNLPYLVDRYDIGEIFGLDISLGQLHRCREYVAHQGWNVQLQLGNAEQLPYLDNTFDGVFHIGGINFFNDKKKAIEEMIRVAKPGTRILIADENEKGAQVYERTLPKFKQSFGQHRPEVVPPIDLIPSEMEEARIFDIWKGWMYCIEFRKPLSGK